MPFEFDRLVALRPYLYHLTARNNVGLIQRDGVLRCTKALLDGAQLEHLTRVRRTEHLVIPSVNGSLVIRDQKPLTPGAIHFESGWSFERFIEHVNEHVFFWPGTAQGPIAAGKNHFARYSSENPVILRIATSSLSASAPLFCRYNSGAPRCSGGKYSPRGPHTYLPETQFRGAPSDVVEVVIKGTAALPANTEASDSPNGPWRPLLRAA